MNGLGDFIRMKRQDMGLSASALAAATGISKQHLYFIEKNNATSISDSKLMKIADVLNIDHDIMLALAGRIKTDVIELYMKDPSKWANEIRDYYAKKEKET